MAMPAWVPEAWARLSEENQKQMGNFLQFLLYQQGEESPVPSLDTMSDEAFDATMRVGLDQAKRGQARDAEAVFDELLNGLRSGA